MTRVQTLSGAKENVLTQNLFKSVHWFLNYDNVKSPTTKSDILRNRQIMFSSCIYFNDTFKKFYSFKLFVCYNYYSTTSVFF